MTYYSKNRYTGNGSTTNRTLTFNFLSRSHVKVYVDGVDTAFSWITDSEVQISPAPSNGTQIEIKRETPKTSREVDWQDGSGLTETDMDTSDLQLLYISQEAFDAAADALPKSIEEANAWDAQDNKITNLADGVADTDAATVGQIMDLTASQVAAASAAQAGAELAEANAAVSETNAGTSATNAAASETNALTYKNNAATSATNAGTSATNAAASETNAATSKTLAEKFAGYKYTYSSTTTAADPGSGALRFNNATLSSATALYISETTANSQGISADMATWDDGSSSIRGRIRVVKQSDPTVFVLYDITGSNVDNGSWQTLTITYVAGNGSISNSDAVSVGFVAKGDKGDTGATGTAIPIVAAGGTVNAITADYTPDITVSDFALVAFRSTGSNTSTTPTFSPDGATARTIVKKGGQALVSGDIGAVGSIHILQYDSSNTRWELLNPASTPSGGQTLGFEKATGQYYWIFGGSSSNFTVTAGIVYFVPVIIPTTRTVTDLVAKVNTLSAGNIRMGLYTDSSGVPGTLVYTAGTASTGSTGYKYINNSQSVAAGLYWIALQFDATPAMEQVGNEANVVGGGFGATILGCNNPPVQSGTGVGRSYYQTQAYASGLPSTASGLTMVTGNTMPAASVYCG